MLVNEECLKSLIRVCDFRTNFPKPFVTPLSFETTECTFYCNTEQLDVCPTKTGFLNSFTIRKNNISLKDPSQGCKLSLKSEVIRLLKKEHKNINP